jgi:hypothetical protein
MSRVWASELLDPIFEKWENKEYTKWDVYPVVFDMMDKGEVNLIDIMDAAHRIGIAPSVVRMRRADHKATMAFWEEVK